MSTKFRERFIVTKECRYMQYPKELYLIIYNVIFLSWDDEQHVGSPIKPINIHLLHPVSVE